MSRVVANFRAVRLSAQGVETMPVVKADAYNHGAAEVARALVHEGAQLFAVASAAEGVSLRASGVDAAILVMADFLACERSAILTHNLTPVLHSLDHIRELSALASEAGRVLPFHLKIDSGLGRLGTRAACSEIAEALRGAKNLVLEGLMTHFASAEDFTTTQTAEQTASFMQTCKELVPASCTPRYIHMSGSNAIAYSRIPAWQTLLRPGLSLYGYVSSPVGEAPPRRFAVEPALTWKAAVLAVKDLPAGVPVGYNARFRTTRPTRMAVVAAGYADGYPHRLGNTGKVIVNGVLAPIMGAVSMDLLTVDVTGCPPVSAGDAVTLLGREGDVKMDAQDIAALAGTIPYAVLCGIGRRVQRVYV